MWARNLNICQNTIFYWTISTNENQREISPTLLEFMHGCSTWCNFVPAQLRGTLMKFVKRFQWCSLLAEAFKQLWQHIIFTCYGCPLLLVSVSFERSSLYVTSSCKQAREIWLGKTISTLTWRLAWITSQNIRLQWGNCYRYHWQIGRWYWVANLPSKVGSKFLNLCGISQPILVIAHKLNPLCLFEGERKALYPPFPFGQIHLKYTLLSIRRLKGIMSQESSRETFFLSPYSFQASACYTGYWQIRPQTT